MRKIITFIAILAVLGGGAYLFLFKRDMIKSTVKEKWAEARGFESAKTPQQAVDLFRKAIQDRDYETASKYCTAGYAEQMRKAGPAATKLGKKIDDFREALNKRGLATETNRQALDLLEPFPTDFEVVELKQVGDDKAVAVIREAVDRDPTKSHILDWKFDLIFCRALAHSLPASPVQIDLKREGKGEQEHWRLDIPVNGAVRNGVDRLLKKHMDYVNAIDVIDTEVKNEPTTKQDVDHRLQAELNKVLQD